MIGYLSGDYATIREDSTTIKSYVGPPTLGYNKRGLKMQ